MKRKHIIICQDCGSNATIKSTNPIAASYSNLYTKCTNPECNSEEVHSLYFSHYITPPRDQATEEAISALNRLPISERQRLSKELGGRS